MPNVTLPSEINSTFNLTLPGGLSLAPTYWEAGLVILLLFLLVLSLGRVRRHIVDWHFRGLFPGIIIGVLITVAIEGFLLVGENSLLGWKEAPKPVSEVLDVGHNKLVGVLGSSSEINLDTITQSIENLNSDDFQKLQSKICVGQ